MISADRRGNKIRVMLVDDHAVMRNGLSAMLSMHRDIEIAGEASDGKEAAGMVRDINPHVILMDINMPKMDGVEATRRIQAEFPNIHIIGLSMYDEADDQAELMIVAGAAAYFNKTGSSKALLEAIRKAAMELAARTPFSRLPVYEDQIDNITGFVLKDDVLISAVQEQGDHPLSTLKRDIIVVLESVSLGHLLELFLKQRQYIAIVVNEHGGTEGLVTLEDIIETLMGMEIMDETDDVEDMRVLARKKWTERIKAMGLEIND